MSKALGYIGLTVAVLLWGFSFISLDVLLQVMTVSELNMLRFLMSTPLLWLLHFIRGKALTIEERDLPMIALAGLFGTAGYYYFESMGLAHISPGMVSVVTGAIPVTTLVIAMLFFGKKTKFKNIGLVMISFAGIVIMMNPLGKAGVNNGLGVGLVMIANTAWALYTLLNEGFSRRYDKLQLLTVQYTFGMVAFTGFYLYELGTHPKQSLPDFRAMLASGETLGHLIFICLFVAIGAYFFYNYALAHIGVMISALFINVVPVVTLVISVAIGYEVLTFNKVMGCLLVVIAIFFIDDI